MLTDLAYVLPHSLDAANYQKINPVDDALDAMPAVLPWQRAYKSALLRGHYVLTTTVRHANQPHGSINVSQTHASKYGGKFSALSLRLKHDV